MKFANFRVPGIRNRCEPCTCQARSHFSLLDDGSAYNIDTGGTIWYQAADSCEWQNIYRCRNYIPWAPAVSRLDHVMRDEHGGTNIGSARSSLRIPCGRPNSGSFFGVQTDGHSAVIFLHGKIVYEGEYRSDCDGLLTLIDHDYCTYYDYGVRAYYNYLTEENCNNNDPPENDNTLYRNTNGQWDKETWIHTPMNVFEPGHITPVFSQIVIIDNPPCEQITAGWNVGIIPQDCCGNFPGFDYETGMHLGTNETGSLVWFTMKKRHEKWWRYIGQVETVDELPNILQLTVPPDSCLQYSNSFPLKDFDVIVVGIGDHWDGVPYSLKDGQWKKHSNTYGEMVMNFPNACIIHESTQGIIQMHDNNMCIKTPDAWIGNAAHIRACGDFTLVNGNIKELDRVLLFEAKEIAREKALKHDSEIDMHDSIACAFSKHYWNGRKLPEDVTGECHAVDGRCFATFTLADGSIRHILAYFNGNEWTIAWDETTAPGEPAWEHGLVHLADAAAPNNCYWHAIGRTWENGFVDRILFYKGELAAAYTYNPAYYGLYGIPFEQIPIGLVAECSAVYQCPLAPNGNLYSPKYSAWNRNGEQILNCSHVYVWCQFDGLPAIISELEPDGETPKWETVSTLYSINYESRDIYSGQITASRTAVITESVSYITAFVVGSGRTLYSPGTLTVRESGNLPRSYSAAGHHWGHGDSFGIGVQSASCRKPIPSGEPVILKSIGTTYHSLLDSCRIGTNHGDWYDTPPQIIGEAPSVDNNYGYGTFGDPIDVSFDTTFIHVYSITDDDKQITLTTDTSTTQHLKFPPPSSGKGMYFDPYPTVNYYNAIESYSRPIWNRVFYYDINYYDTITSSNAVMRCPYQDGNCEGFSQDHQSYTSLKIPADTDGKATDELLIDLLIPGAESDFMETQWISAGSGKAQKTFYALQKETAVCQEQNYPYNTITVVTKYISHVVIIEAELDSQGSKTYYINARVADYIIDETVFGEPDEYCQNNADITQTLFYKRCATPDTGFSMRCGYMFISHGTGSNQITEVSWKGNVLYTSPPITTGTWSYTTSCCRDARIIEINEIIYESGTETPATKQLRVYIEGNEAYTGDIKSYEEGEHITIRDCCATHLGKYRYALLGIGDLIEDADIGNDTMTLTDGTLAERLSGDLFATIDGTYFIPDEAIAKKTIIDERKRMLFCNGAPLSNNKRYDGLHCCGEYAMCVYVDDDYLSGWKNDLADIGVYETQRKWCPHPGWGDVIPPAAKDRAMWDFYRALYPGFAADVFCKGSFIGTYKLSDVNSPVHYDRLGTNGLWLLFATRSGRHDIGYAPWSLEGAPMCGGEKLLIPFDGGITTCLSDDGGAASERRVFS